MKNMQYNSRICLIPRLNLKLKKEKIQYSRLSLSNCPLTCVKAFVLPEFSLPPRSPLPHQPTLIMTSSKLIEASASASQKIPVKSYRVFVVRKAKTASGINGGGGMGRKQCSKMS